MSAAIDRIRAELAKYSPDLCFADRLVIENALCEVAEAAERMGQSHGSRCDCDEAIRTALAQLKETAA